MKNSNLTLRKKNSPQVGISFLLFVFWSLSLVTLPASYSGGDGSISNPYRMSNCQDFIELSNHPEDWTSNSFIQTCDIDFGDESHWGDLQFNDWNGDGNVDMVDVRGFSSIGDSERPFSGQFDGNCFSLKGFMQNFQCVGAENYAGLFGYTENNGKPIFRNITMVEPSLTVVCEDVKVLHLGSLVGYLNAALLLDCQVIKPSIYVESHSSRLTSINVGAIGGVTTSQVLDSNVEGGLIKCQSPTADEHTFRVGGVFGVVLNSGYIARSKSNTVIEVYSNAGNSIGGVLGSNSGRIADCSSSSTILLVDTANQEDENGLYSSTGGLIGTNHSSLEVLRCYSTGVIKGGLVSGGLIGFNIAPVRDCYSLANVNAQHFSGGLLGNTLYGGVTNSYAAGRIQAVACESDKETVTDAIAGDASLTEVNGLYYDSQRMNGAKSDLGTGITKSQFGVQDNLPEFRFGYDFDNPWYYDNEENIGRPSLFFPVTTISIEGSINKEYDAQPVDMQQISYNTSYPEGEHHIYYRPNGAESGDLWLSFAPSKAGVYDVKVVFEGSIEAPSASAIKTAAIVITKAPLVFTALNKEMIYTGDVYSRGYVMSISGFKNGENMTDLSGELIYGGSSQTATKVGVYPIKLSGVSSNNYDITFIDATLKIVGLFPSITIAPVEQDYCGTPISANVEVEGGRSTVYYRKSEKLPEDPGLLWPGISLFEIGWDTVAPANAGQYDVIVVTDANDIYKAGIEIMKGAVKINKANLVISTLPEAIGAVPPNWIVRPDVIIDGFEGDDSIDDLKGLLTFDGLGEGFGEYTVLPQGLRSENYDITYVEGVIEVEKMLPDVNVENKVVDYSAKAISANISISKSVEASILYRLSNSSGLWTDEEPVNANTYDVRVITMESSFYKGQDIVYEDALMINKVLGVRVVVTPYSKIYDGEPIKTGHGVEVHGLVGDETLADLSGALTLIGLPTSSKVGVYTISSTGVSSDNYEISFESGDYKIEEEFLVVTANSYVKEYDGLPYAGEGGVKMVSNSGDVLDADLGGSIMYSVSPEGFKPGEYTITPYGLSSSNYMVTYESNSLVINKAVVDLQVDANSLVFAYDGEEKFIEYSSSVDVPVQVVFTKDGVEVDNLIDVGEYGVSLVVDEEYYEGHATEVVKIVDVTAPEIEFVDGDGYEILYYGEDYIPKEVIITDDVTADITPVVGLDDLNVFEVGNYEVTYTAVDDAGNSSEISSIVMVIFNDDTDGDGVNDEFEDLNGNDDLRDDDTDGDGIPNYLDTDDDGDNILTSKEGLEDSDCDNALDYLDDYNDSKFVIKWGDVILLRDSLKQYSSFQWYRDGIAIPGATKRYYYEDGGLNGVYNISAVKDDGTEFYSCDYYANIKVEGRSLKVSMYPNPIEYPVDLNVDISSVGDALGDVNVKVYSMTGQTVYETTLGEGVSQLNLPELMMSSYSFVFTNSTGEMEVIKLTIK